MAALPATAPLPKVATDPATATLETVPNEPATATLPTVPMEPATMALPTVATDAITPALPAVAMDSGASNTLSNIGPASQTIADIVPIHRRTMRKHRWESAMADEGFPDARWGSESSPLRGFFDAFAATPLGSRCVRALVPLDRRLLIRTKGRYTVLGPFGYQVLVLTTIGRKSGQRRQSPLIYTRDGDRLYLFGSNFGQSAHPAWSTNLLANPDTWVTMGGKEIPVRATRLEGEEYDRACELFMNYLKAYPAYQTRTDRDIRVFALDRR